MNRSQGVGISQLRLLGPLRLVAQVGCGRVLAAAVALLHICGPERGTDGVGEGEEDACDGNEL